MFENVNEEFGSMKILAVDDDINTLVFMKYILKNRYKIETLERSRDIFTKLESYKPDLILMDVMMPDIGGFELCRQLKQHEEFSTIPVILITARTDDHDLYEGLEAGAVDYIRKPFSETELVARINTSLKNEIVIRKLKRLNRLKDNFLSMVSHDIKTPLTSIIGFSELLLEERIAGVLTEKQRKLVCQIVDSANHQSRIIKDLLNYSVLETGKINLFVTSHPLINIIDKSLSEVNFIAGKKNIHIHSLVTEDFMVECDNDRITQVLTNLMTNAIKFTPEHGTIEIDGKKEGDIAKISVRDSGVGISEESIAKIFDQYELFTTKGTEGEKGTGLGIAICNKIVTEHGGTLSVESKPDDGTTFSFTLPYVKKSV